MENKSYVEAFRGTKVDKLASSVLGPPNIGEALSSTSRSVNQVCAIIGAVHLPEHICLESLEDSIARLNVNLKVSFGRARRGPITKKMLKMLRMKWLT